jgi:hypothetical protein
VGLTPQKLGGTIKKRFLAAFGVISYPMGEDSGSTLPLLLVSIKGTHQFRIADLESYYY